MSLKKRVFFVLTVLTVFIVRIKGIDEDDKIIEDDVVQLYTETKENIKYAKVHWPKLNVNQQQHIVDLYQRIQNHEAALKPTSKNPMIDKKITENRKAIIPLMIELNKYINNIKLVHQTHKEIEQDFKIISIISSQIVKHRNEIDNLWPIVPENIKNEIRKKNEIPSIKSSSKMHLMLINGLIPRDIIIENRIGIKKQLLELATYLREVLYYLKQKYAQEQGVKKVGVQGKLEGVGGSGIQVGQGQKKTRIG